MKTERKLIPLTEEHQRLLEERGLNLELVTRLGWQSSEDGRGDTIAIPYFRKGKVVGRKYRTIKGEKRFSQDKGSEQCLYNLEVIEEIKAMPAETQKTVQLVITEGEMDAIVAMQCGYFAVSVPNGAPDKPVENEESTKFDYLNDLPRSCVIIVASDADEPGQILAHEIGARVGYHRCKWVQYPKGCKDLNDTFKRFGEKGVNMVLKDKAKFGNISGLVKLSDIPTTPPLPTYECGISPIISTNVLLRPGDIMVLSGFPSMGKSTVANCIAAKMAKNYGWHVTLAPFESRVRGSMLAYLRTFFIGKASEDWQAIDVTAADAWVEKNFSFIVADLESDDLMTLSWLKDRIIAAVTQHGSRLVVVDPWNELDHDRPHGMSLTEYTGFAIKELKRLAMRFAINIIIVAHPAKPQKKNANGGYDVPTLFDVSDSAHWKNKTDIGIICHHFKRSKDEPPVMLLRAEKIKEWGVIGWPGDYYMEYIPYRGEFVDIEGYEPPDESKPKKAKRKKKSTDDTEAEQESQQPA